MRALLLGFAASIVAVGAMAACGARTGLRVDEARADAGVDAPEDAPPDVPEDVPPDVPEEPPPPVDCVEAGITYIYVVSSQFDLFSFYPPTGVFTQIGAGPLDCPAMGGTPFSMAVDRSGTAYVVYTDGELFKVSTKDGSCEATDFLPNQQGFLTFGMGFSADGPESGAGETLYVAEGHPGGAGPSLGLATIDTDTFELKYIGPFSTDVSTGGELTGTGDGRLYTFYLNADMGSHIDEVEKPTAKILSDVALPTGEGVSAFAFAFWGGDFYIFTAPNGGTTVTRYRPSDGSVTDVAFSDDTIVGAGVSTCAPQ